MLKYLFINILYYIDIVVDTCLLIKYNCLIYDDNYILTIKGVFAFFIKPNTKLNNDKSLQFIAIKLRVVLIIYRYLYYNLIIDNILESYLGNTIIIYINLILSRFVLFFSLRFIILIPLLKIVETQNCFINYLKKGYKRYILSPVSIAINLLINTEVVREQTIDRPTTRPPRYPRWYNTYWLIKVSLKQLPKETWNQIAEWIEGLERSYAQPVVGITCTIVNLQNTPLLWRHVKYTIRNITHVNECAIFPYPGPGYYIDNIPEEYEFGHQMYHQNNLIVDDPELRIINMVTRLRGKDIYDAHLFVFDRGEKMANDMLKENLKLLEDVD